MHVHPAESQFFFYSLGGPTKGSQIFPSIFSLEEGRHQNTETMDSSSEPSSSSASSSSSSSSDAGPSTPPSKHTSLSSIKGDDDVPAWQQPYTFHTLKNQERFENPSADGFDHEELQRLTAPHLESFNALWAADPAVSLPAGAKSTTVLSEGVGLLEKSIRNIRPRVVFDGTDEAMKRGDLGNRLEFIIENVTLGRPMSNEKGRTALQSRIFPAEVCMLSSPFVSGCLLTDTTLGKRTTHYIQSEAECARLLECQWPSKAVRRVRFGPDPRHGQVEPVQHPGHEQQRAC